jgi:hypothetical protein
MQLASQAYEAAVYVNNMVRMLWVATGDVIVSIFEFEDFAGHELL